MIDETNASDEFETCLRACRDEDDPNMRPFPVARAERVRHIINGMSGPVDVPADALAAAVVAEQLLYGVLWVRESLRDGDGDSVGEASDALPKLHEVFMKLSDLVGKLESKRIKASATGRTTSDNKGRSARSNRPPNQCR